MFRKVFRAIFGKKYAEQNAENLCVNNMEIRSIQIKFWLLYVPFVSITQ